METTHQSAHEGARAPGPTEEHLAFLARAGERLASSLDLRTTLRNLARLAVPALADYAVIDLLEEDGSLRRVECAHVDAGKEPLLREGGGQREIEAWFVEVGPRLMAQGEPILTGTGDAPSSRRGAPSSRRGATMLPVAGLGTVSAISAPLVASGRSLGILTLGTAESGRRYGPAELAIVQDLARRAALSIDNAYLYAAEQRARQAADRDATRIVALQRMTAALSEAMTRAKVAEVIAEHMTLMLPDCRVVVYAMAPDGQSLTCLHAAGYSAEQVERFRSLPLSFRSPVTDAVRAREPVFMASSEGAERRYPELTQAIPALAAARSHQLVAVPFMVEDRVLGVLGLSLWPTTWLAEGERAFVFHTARTCAQALERARLYEAERAARAEAEAERRRLALLAEASAVLNASLDPAAITDALARTAVPRFASYCIVCGLEEDGTPRFLHAVHEDPAKEATMRAMRERYAFGHHHPIDEVARTGKSKLERVIDAAWVRQIAEDDEHLAMLHSIPTASSIVVPLNARGHTLGVLSFGLAEGHYEKADVALAEELAHRAALALDNARLYHEAQEASRVKDEFLGVVSHELRTPLNAILGWARMLRTGTVREGSQPRALEAIERNAINQARLIDDLLDASRITAGKMRLDASIIQLSPVIEAAVQAVTPGATAKDICIQTAFEQGESPVLGDPSRLQQIVWNLLSNAIKFTPKGGRIEVRLTRAGDEATLIVSDNGRGIRADLLPHVFERFRQGDGTLTRHSGGLGLGLSIVRHLVEAHGGTVRAESPGADQGATFTVKLPIAKPSAQTASSPAVDANRSDTPVLSGVRVLVVDDEPDAREILAEVLSQAGAEVKTAAEPAEALNVLSDFMPDVLVSDLAMPGQDGLTLIRKIRARAPDKVSLIPAIALTAYARPEDRVQALAAGFQMHVPKPVDPTELVVTIASLRAMTPRQPTPPPV
jgi:signal transduction histidine kinase/ActR/RegA family two-component response regulator